MELPSVFHPYFLHSPPVVYLWYFNYTEGSHQGIRCLSIVTHIAVNNSPLRVRARMHIGVQGHGPRRDWIIASTDLIIDKNRIFLQHKPESPPYLCHLSGHPCTQCLCMQITQDLGQLTRHHPGDTEETYTCERTTLPFAWTGKGFGAAPVPSMTQDTSAQGVVQPLMELMGVLECRKIKVLTLYHQEAWEDEFHKAGPSEKYSHIVTGLHHGFHIGLPLINNTQSPPNKDSVVEFTDEFNRIVQSKIQKGFILVQSQDETWNPLLVHSYPHPFQSFWNQDKLTNTIIFRTTHSQAPPPTTSQIHPSTHRLTWTCSLQHGAHLLSLRYSYNNCHQAHNWPQEMLQKHTESFLSITPSGRPQLSAWKMTCLQSTLCWPSGQDLQLGCMAQLEMQPQTFCGSKGLDQSPVMLTITYSSGSHTVCFQSTIRNAGHGMETSFPEVSTKMEVEFGSEEGDSKMEHLKNSMKTAPFLARTFQHHQIDQWKICHMPTTLMILMLHHSCWGSHGRSQRTDPLLVQQPTLVSTGTLKLIDYLWQIARKRNTSWQQRIDFHKPHIHLKRWRDSTANSYMHALSGPLDEHISQSWSACLEYSTIVHSYHTPVQGDFEKTWNGGLTSFDNPSCQG